MRLRQLDLDCETKTCDHVFLRVQLAIQYQTNASHLYESVYSLASPVRKITSHTLDILRATLPRMELDDIFSSHESIANELSSALNEAMNEYGYIIQHALITKIEPNSHVKYSMNEIQASKRMKESCPFKAEAVRIKIIKNAEAKAERYYLNGVGVARERNAIAGGMKDVVDTANEDSGVTSKSIMDLLLLTQYLDVITDLNGAKGREGAGQSSSMFLYHQPETVSQLTATARVCF